MRLLATLEEIKNTYAGKWIALHHEKDELICCAEDYRDLHRELERQQVTAVRVLRARPISEPSLDLRL